MGARRINITKTQRPCACCATYCMHVTNFGMPIERLCKGCPGRAELIWSIQPRPRRIVIRRSR